MPAMLSATPIDCPPGVTVRSGVTLTLTVLIGIPSMRSVTRASPARCPVSVTRDAAPSR